jgi:hypothetical protein
MRTRKLSGLKEGQDAQSLLNSDTTYRTSVQNAFPQATVACDLHKGINMIHDLPERPKGLADVVWQGFVMSAVLVMSQAATCTAS